MNVEVSKQDLIEETGKKYNDIIFGEDYIPKEIYLHQIALRNEKIRKCLKDLSYEVILDLGCGTGFHLSELTKHASTMVGTDLSFGALKECKKRYDAEFVLCDARHLPFRERSFDVIWIAGLLHHIPDYVHPTVRNNISPIMKKGALIFIDEPNAKNPVNFVNMKLSKADPTGDERPLSAHFVTGALLEENAFQVISCEFYGLLSPIGAILSNPDFQKFFQWFDIQFGKSLLRKMALRWMIVAKRN
jgi:SAM-dependent methyltransferase